MLQQHPFTSAATAEVFSFLTTPELCRAAELQAALRPLATHEDRREPRGACLGPIDLTEKWIENGWITMTNWDY